MQAAITPYLLHTGLTTISGQSVGYIVISRRSSINKLGNRYLLLGFKILEILSTMMANTQVSDYLTSADKGQFERNTILHSG